MEEHLLALPEVVGFGFRYDVLQLDLDKDVLDRSGIEQSLTKTLGELGITELAYRYVGRHIVPFKRPGEGIRRDGFPGTATLGCFARSNKGYYYALTARHFTGELEGTLISSLNEEPIGTLANVHYKTDIAAILVMRFPLKPLGLEYFLRDEQNLALKICCELLTDYQTPMNVYIIGAQSRPGLGRLVSTRYYFGALSHLLLIESLTPASPFCRPGDSGAIVIGRVSHNKVIAIGMVIGRSDLESRCPTQFLAVRLDHSLPALEEQLEDKLHLITSSANQ